jgi:hypothetical protein
MATLPSVARHDIVTKFNALILINTKICCIYIVIEIPVLLPPKRGLTILLKIEPKV